MGSYATSNFEYLKLVLGEANGCFSCVVSASTYKAGKRI